MSERAATARGVRGVAGRLLAAWMSRRSEPMPPGAWRRDTLVLAPHPDDETLGCGGTIALKRRAGARVHVVFLTDGAAAGHDLLDPAALRAMRRREAIEACAELGVDSGDIEFLEYADGGLAEGEAEATEQVARVLASRRPSDLLLPHRHDGHPDHVVTNRVARTAVASVGSPVDLYEYPIWAWGHWPWVGLDAYETRERLAPRTALDALTEASRRGFGLRLARDLDVAADVREVLDRKRAALARHRSQFERPEGTLADWPTLTGTWRGAFVPTLMRPVERFRRTALGAEQA